MNRADEARRTSGAPRGPQAPPRRRHAKTILLVVLAVILSILLAVVGSFAWLQWFSHDDAADIQGTWYLAGTSTPVTITEDRIQLTSDVSYRYTINDQDKSFELNYGSLKGSGCYRFSLDRQQLALVDGEEGGLQAVGSDFAWTLAALVEAAQNRTLAPATQGETGVTLLSRTPVTDSFSKVGDK